MSESKVSKLLGKASTDKAFYKECCSSLKEVSAEYQLDAKELEAVKQGLVKINPTLFPDGRFVPRKSDLS